MSTPYYTHLTSRQSDLFPAAELELVRSRVSKDRLPVVDVGCDLTALIVWRLARRLGVEFVVHTTTDDPYRSLLEREMALLDNKFTIVDGDVSSIPDCGLLRVHTHSLTETALRETVNALTRVRKPLALFVHHASALRSRPENASTWMTSDRGDVLVADLESAPEVDTDVAISNSWSARDET